MTSVLHETARVDEGIFGYPLVMHVTPLGDTRLRPVVTQRKPVRSVILLAAIMLLLPFISCSRFGSGKASGSGAAGQASRSTVTRGSNNDPAGKSPPKHLTGTVYLDPGHGGVDSGTSGVTNEGVPVDEKTVVLQIALRLAQRLRADGLTVVMTRTTDADPCIKAGDLAPDGESLTAAGVLDDLQCRIDKANASKAQVLLSLHMNSYSDPSVSGTETFYDSARSFAGQNQQFAELVQQNLMDALHAQGYSTPDRGVSADSQTGEESMGTLPSSYNHLVLLGPGVPGQLVPSQMPGALTEIFFLSNPNEATAVTEPGVQDVIADALADAIEAFLTQGG